MQRFELHNRKGLRIIGTIQLPQNPIGVAFVMHGLGGFKEQPAMQTIANALFTNNYVAVIFDATCSIGESDGLYEEATMQNHYEDLVDVINWARTQPWYQGSVILAGHSLGGFAVTKYATEFPQHVQALCAFAAVFVGADCIEAAEKYNPEMIAAWRETGWMNRVSASKPGTQLRLPWSHMTERLQHDLRGAAHLITMPLLCIVGENDTDCPPYQQKAFYDLLPQSTPKEFHIVPNASHVFRESTQLDELRDIIDRWVKGLF